MDTPAHLEPIWTDRGFKHMPEIEDRYGTTVQVIESSAATAPHIYLFLEPCGLDSVAAHLTLEDAAKLRDQLDYLIRNHYQLETEAQREEM